MMRVVTALLIGAASAAKYDGVPCTEFKAPWTPCSAEDYAAWTAKGVELGFTDFKPGNVNWRIATPVSPDGESILTYGEGVGLVVGGGITLTVLAVILTLAEGMLRGSSMTSEEFNTAGRNVKIGLTASVIVSQWTWAATLLQSSNKAWQVGISGPFWYASGATVQILLFGIIAVEIKRKCPNCHTFLEIVDARWGTCAHLTFLVFAFFTNALVTGMLLLGGSDVINWATTTPCPDGTPSNKCPDDGVENELTSFLYMWVVVVYTVLGGLKATFLAGYFNTTIIMAGLAVFITAVYTLQGDRLVPGITMCQEGEQCNAIGSAGAMYERLAFIITLGGEYNVGNQSGYLSRQAPNPANRGGSYLTMLSDSGIMFGVINTVGNFGTVFVDQSYWQSAIAASPASAHKGYLLGGLVWFTIPFALATSLGLASNALNVALTGGDAGAGLVPPAAAIVLTRAPDGSGGAGGFLMIVMLFMAIISTGSAECIAVSSLFAYDIYRTYCSPSASGKCILWLSRIIIVVWAFVMAICSIILDAMGIGLGWVYNFMGICIGSAVVPISCVIITDKLGPMFAIVAAITGFVCAVIAWIVTGYAINPDVCEDGVSSLMDDTCVVIKSLSLFLDVTGQLNAQLAGNLVAILSSLIICVIGCVCFPMNFDWKIMMEGITLVGGDGGENAKVLGAEWESRPEFLEHAKAWIIKYGWGLTLFLTVAWPTMMVPFGAFGKSSFQIWASIALCWGWMAGIIIIGLPIFENRAILLRVCTCNPVKEGEAKEESKPETAVA